MIANNSGLNCICGDEKAISYFNEKEFDVSFTMGVMDHLTEESFQLALGYLYDVTKKVIFCLETNETPAAHYYPHDYENLGFQRIKDFPQIGGDGATYTLWRSLCLR